MDDEDIDLNDTPHRSRRGTRHQVMQEPKIKYMAQLQEVANRERDAITIELEDLKEVGAFGIQTPFN